MRQQLEEMDEAGWTIHLYRRGDNQRIVLAEKFNAPSIIGKGATLEDAVKAAWQDFKTKGESVPALQQKGN